MARATNWSRAERSTLRPVVDVGSSSRSTGHAGSAFGGIATVALFCLSSCDLSALERFDAGAGVIDPGPVSRDGGEPDPEADASPSWDRGLDASASLDATSRLDGGGVRDASAPRDGGVALPDADLLDAGAALPDADLLDAGAALPDADLLDASAALPDADLLDAGAVLPDAGAEPLDAGAAPDAGAGLRDAGAAPDAGAGPRDAGVVASDAGSRSCADVDLGSQMGSPVILGSTAQRGDDSAACGGAGNDVSFRWVAPSAGRYRIDTCGSTFDTVLVLRSGTCTGPLIDCEDDSVECDLNAILLETLAAGEEVVIVVDGYSSSGFFILNIALEP